MTDCEPIMYVPRMDAFLNLWFASYDEARAALQAQGGYLLPYRDQYFVSPAEAIRELGLDPADPDWAAIDWDWEGDRMTGTDALHRCRHILVIGAGGAGIVRMLDAHIADKTIIILTTRREVERFMR